MFSLSVSLINIGRRHLFHPLTVGEGITATVSFDELAMKLNRVFNQLYNGH